MRNLILLSLLFSANILCAQEISRKKHFNLTNGIALQGYDPICYFTLKKAVKGSREISTITNGISYYFTTIANKNLFLTSPSSYEPQYGGWCAYAMGATNEKVEVDPETFKIVNGKLYLFYHSWLNNTLTKWNKDEANLKAKADKNWAVIFN